MNLYKKPTLIILLLGAFVSQLYAQDYKYLIPDKYKLETIVIDAGHGGYDNGAAGLNSKEKDIALQVALQLGNKIQQNLPNTRVIYTRTSDQFVTLQERANKANSSNASLFISLHCNASNKSKKGVEVYTLGNHRSHESLEVAMRENGSILIEEYSNSSYQHFDPVSPNSYSYGFFQPHSNQSLSVGFASQIDQSFRRIGQHSEGVKQAEFLILRESRVPSVLVQLGFMTNSSEESFMNSANGKSQITNALIQAIQNYKSELDMKAKQILETKREEIQQIEERKRQDAAARKRAELERQRKLEANWAWPALHTLKMKGETYMVQLKISKNFDEKNFPFNKIVMNRIDVIDSYKYLAGPFSSKADATAAHKKAQEAGFRNAFVLRYIDGKIVR